MVYGGDLEHTDEKEKVKGIQIGGRSRKRNTQMNQDFFVIDTGKVLNLSEFETVLYAFKGVSSYKVKLSTHHQLIIQIVVISGQRFDDFDQSLALRLGHYFKVQFEGGLRFLIQEI